MDQNNPGFSVQHPSIFSYMIRKAIIFFTILLLFQSPGLTLGARLNNIIVTNTRDHLLVYMSVDGAFREEIKKAILSGVPVSFVYVIELHRERNFWPDKTLAEIRAIHTIKYDNLKKEFSIERSWETGDPAVTKSFEQARKLMTEIDSLKVVPLIDLNKGTQYQIRAKAELSKRTLPFYLHYVLFFVSLWDFETDWYTIDFIY